MKRSWWLRLLERLDELEPWWLQYGGPRGHYVDDVGLHHACSACSGVIECA